MDEHAVRTTALAQLGLITREQVIANQGSDRAIRRRIETGRWERLREGVYVVGAVAPSWEQTALGALLAAGPGTRLSQRSAARALGLVERSGRLQVAVPDRRRVRLQGVTVHRPFDLPQSDTTMVGSLATTSTIRTLIDLAPSQSAAAMGVIVDTAIRDHGVDPQAIALRIVELARPGRVVPRSLIECLTMRSPGYDPGRSALESRVIAAITTEGLPLPVRQHPVLRPDGRRAYIDLAYPDDMLALEADSWKFHGQRAAFDADRVRGNDLVLLGWSVLRVTSAMSDSHVCTTVRGALGR